MARKAQASLDHAIDLWLGELARRGRSPRTRLKYRQLVDPFAAMCEHLAPAEITADHCRRYLDRWANHSPSTLALYVTALAGLFEFLYDEGIVPRDPMERVKRPPRKRPEDLDVVSVTDRDVRRMFDACETWQELICLAVVCYLGVRRHAASTVRRRDCDLERGTIRFHEKGGKIAVKPIPDELAAILRAAEQQQVWTGPDDYLIPNRRRSTVRVRGERGHKVIYETVKKIAARAGVTTHVHALRAAFAVKFDEAHPDQVIALKELLGHARLETTLVYLRRKDKQAAMETVRDLSWGSSVFPARAVVPPTGFEPVLPVDADAGRPGAVTDTDQVPAALQAKLLELSQAAKRKGRVDA
jgi:integrase